MTGEETKWEVEMEPDHQESTKVSLLQGWSEARQYGCHQSWSAVQALRPHPGLLNRDLNFNKVPEDVDEVAEAQY